MHRIYKVGEAGVYKSFLVEYIFIVSMWTSSIHKWEYKMVKGQIKDFFRNTYILASTSQSVLLVFAALMSSWCSSI